MDLSDFTREENTLKNIWNPIFIMLTKTFIMPFMKEVMEDRTTVIDLKNIFCKGSFLCSSVGFLSSDFIVGSRVWDAVPYMLDTSPNPARDTPTIPLVTLSIAWMGFFAISPQAPNCDATLVKAFADWKTPFIKGLRILLNTGAYVRKFAKKIKDTGIRLSAFPIFPTNVTLSCFKKDIPSWFSTRSS